MLFLRGAQLVLRSSVLAVLELYEVDALSDEDQLKSDDIQVGAVWGRWIC